MKTNYFYLGALLVCFASCTKKEEVKVVEKDVAVEKDAVPSENTPLQPMDSVAMMKAWQEYATPGEMHKMLANDTGSWDEEVTMWMSPDGKPSTSKMTAETKMILGGRYQESRHKGTFEGMPFEGISTVAYNNASKEYNSTWIDNMATGIMTMNGKYDEATKSINFTGECVDPMTKKTKKIRQVMTMIDANTQKMESYDITPDGKEYKSMEIKMNRKK